MHFQSMLMAYRLALLKFQSAEHHSSQFRLPLVSLGSGTIVAEFRGGGLKDWDSNALMILVKTTDS